MIRAWFLDLKFLFEFAADLRNFKSSTLASARFLSRFSRAACGLPCKPHPPARSKSATAANFHLVSQSQDSPIYAQRNCLLSPRSVGVIAGCGCRTDGLQDRVFSFARQKLKLRFVCVPAEAEGDSAKQARGIRPPKRALRPGTFFRRHGAALGTELQGDCKGPATD
jgi:hypothetical protein